MLGFMFIGNITHLEGRLKFRYNFGSARYSLDKPDGVLNISLRLQAQNIEEWRNTEIMISSDLSLYVNTQNEIIGIRISFPEDLLDDNEKE